MVRWQVARAIALDEIELMKQLGVPLWEPAGKDAVALVRDTAHARTRDEHLASLTLTKLRVCLDGAASLPQDRRQGELQRATEFLSQLDLLFKANPVLERVCPYAAEIDRLRARAKALGTK